MDRSGIIEYVDGKCEGDKMQFQNETVDQNGNKIRGRLTLFNLGQDRVRQFFEQSLDGGETWQVQYDFISFQKK